MTLKTLFEDKSLKPKQKTETLSKWVLDGTVSIPDLIGYASKAKDPVKATCIEALEFATKQKPELGNKAVLDFATGSLRDKAPRIKWESAKVIGNIASQHASALNTAISNLLDNSDHEGTVVRWSAAYALGEIIKLRSKLNKDLIPAVEAICEKEEKNSIRKIYLDALKKSKH